MLATQPSKFPRFTSTEDSVVELSLMMSRRQFEALENQACAHGVSVAQFLRRLVQESIETDEPVGQCV